MLGVTEAEVDNWLPRALRTSLTHWRYRPRNLPPLQPQAAAQVTPTPGGNGQAPSRLGHGPQGCGHGGVKEDQRHRASPRHAWAPRP